MTHTQPPYSPTKGNPSNNRPRAVVLVGASIRSAAESAKKAGIRVTGVDLFGDMDTRAACDQFFQIPLPHTLDRPKQGGKSLDAILDACAGMPVLSVGGLNGHQILTDGLAKVCHPLGPPQSTEVQLRDPSQLASIARAAGIQVPRTYAIDPMAKRRNDLCGKRWLLKQPNSSGGWGVRWRVRTESDQGRDVTRGGIISQWVPGRSFGVSFLSDGTSAILIGICRSLFTRKGDCPFVYAGSLGPIRLDRPITDQLRRLGQSVVDASHLQGLFNADVVVDSANQVWLLEINPRWSGSTELIERSWRDGSKEDPNFSLFGVALDAVALPRSPIDSDPEGPAYWKRILYARATKTFRLGDVRSQVAKNQSLHDIPRDGTLIQRGAPVLTLVTTLDSVDNTVLQSYRAFRKRIERST